MKIKIFKFLSIVTCICNSLYSVSGPMYSKDGKYLGYLLDSPGIYKQHLYKGAVYKCSFRERIVCSGDADLYSNDVLFDVNTLYSVGAILLNQEAKQYIINASNGSIALYGKDIRIFLAKFIKEQKCRKEPPLYPMLKNKWRNQMPKQPLLQHEDDCYCNFKLFMNMSCDSKEQFVKISTLHT